MKKITSTLLLLGGLSLGAGACATTQQAAEAGAANASKELSTTGSDAQKGADYVEEDAKKTTEGDQK